MQLTLVYLIGMVPTTHLCHYTHTDANQLHHIKKSRLGLFSYNPDLKFVPKLVNKCLLYFCNRLSCECNRLIITLLINCINDIAIYLHC